MEKLISTVVLFIIIFGVVVLSHEFGHFLLAKMNGIHVVEFSVGMGPAIWSFTRKETKYAIRLLPIGGACMFEGEDGLEHEAGRAQGEAASHWPTSTASMPVRIISET